MADSLKSERTWVWKIDLPVTRFHGPLEAFWRGLGYEVRWKEEELVGERDLEGQRRTFAAQLREREKGTIELQCHVQFDGVPRIPRRGELSHPTELTDMLGRALSLGFGTARASA